MTDHNNSSRIEFAVFNVGRFTCGLDIASVQEINKNLVLTKVDQAPEYVSGIINLRGQIVTIINLRGRLGLEQRKIDENTRNVVVNSGDEKIGLLVDDVDDIITIDPQKILQAPPHMGQTMGNFFTGVIQRNEELVGILDVEKVVSCDTG